MKNRKIVGLLLSLTLVLMLALPGTLAMPTDSGEDVASDSNCTPETEGSVADENMAEDESKENFENMDNIETDADAENDGVVEGVDDVSDSDAVYVGETTGAEEIASASNAATSTTRVFVHLVTCVDGCTGEGCECECHFGTIFERLMNTDSLEEFEDLLEEFDAEERDSLSDEQWELVDRHVIELLPDLEPEIIVGEDEASVDSEIITVSVNFTDVAPICGFTE